MYKRVLEKKNETVLSTVDYFYKKIDKIIRAAEVLDKIFRKAEEEDYELFQMLDDEFFVDIDGYVYISPYLYNKEKSARMLALLINLFGEGRKDLPWKNEISYIFRDGDVEVIFRTEIPENCKIVEVEKVVKTYEMVC